MGLGAEGGGRLGRLSQDDVSTGVFATFAFSMTKTKVVVETKVVKVGRTERAKEVMLSQRKKQNKNIVFFSKRPQTISKNCSHHLADESHFYPFVSNKVVYTNLQLSVLVLNLI